MSETRIDKTTYYLEIAQTVAMRSTCLRRKYGAIIVKNDEIIATGFNGAPRGERNCIDTGYCERERLNIPKGTRYELCVSVHAEQNCVISAARRDMIGATMYIVGLESDNSYANPKPCLFCRRYLVNAGITKCIGMYPGEGPKEISLAPKYPEFDIGDLKPETKYTCPVCHKEINPADIDTKDSNEDGYGGMTVAYTCPHCNTGLTANYESAGYKLTGFEVNSQ